jgi:hypothetical protein
MAAPNSGVFFAFRSAHVEMSNLTEAQTVSSLRAVSSKAATARCSP